MKLEPCGEKAINDTKYLTCHIPSHSRRYLTFMGPCIVRIF